MREIDNFCVGACPMGCAGCNRKHDVLIVTCDWCGEQIDYQMPTSKDDDIDVPKVNGWDVCPECFKKYEDGELDDEGNEVEEE